ncbi:HNH endonuclease signature motif containing protein [Mycolicibacterium bacteremicum]|uniref:HNH endonuclease signature motif containing protein n=1 Tax=Mycolicibacterium bacteremicum TaxID=564198 RepID=UPI0026F0CB4F|nr:HNH endonuclease signature motif containing protein [Mycolicibacterium bacteremicum]
MSSDVVGSRVAVQTALSDRAASVKALLDADFTAFDTAELLAIQSEREERARADEAIDHRILAALMGRATAHEIGGKTWADVLSTRMRLSGAEAGRRIRAAKDLGPRHAIGGEPLAPLLPACAQALADGTINDGHIAVIRKAVKEAAKYVSPAKCAELEQILVPVAVVGSPETVTEAATQALMLLNQDGNGPDVARHKRGLRIGKQDADGLTHISGWIDAELAAYLGTALDVWARPGVNNPEDPDSAANPEPNPLDKIDVDSGGDGSPTADVQSERDHADPNPKPQADSNIDSPAASSPPADAGPGCDVDTLPQPTDFGQLADRMDAVAAAQDAAPRPVFDFEPPADTAAARDSRTRSQRNHDALKAILRDTLMSKRLGSHGGLPVTLVVSTTLRELEEGAGVAVTGTGVLMPMPDLIRLAEHAYHYLVVYRKHTAEPLYMGRSKRLATKAQRLLLYNRDRGCTRPGCTRCANQCQAHHADPSWKNGGRTDANTLGLGCPPDNQLAELGWTTKIDPDTGRVHWYPPPLMDVGGDTVNHHFHPEELLGRPKELPGHLREPFGHLDEPSGGEDRQ